METETKPARFVGRTNIIGIVDEMDCWNCPECNQLFHSVSHNRGKKVICPCCKNRIVLDVYGGFE
jgi:hypothetical protein